MFEVDESVVKKGKWVDRQLRTMDPEVDYDRMIALFAEYTLDEFSLYYTVVGATIHNILPKHGAETLAYTNKVIRRPARRNEDGLTFFWTWFANGSNHQDTIASVQRLNKIHANVARMLPGHFSDNSDFVYTLSALGVYNHRLLLKLGLPGMPSYLQAAMHKFLQNISKHFRAENGAELVGFPSSFDEMLQYCVRWENRPHEYTPVSTDLSNAMISAFAHRWFPSPLRWLGRDMMLYALQDVAIRHHRLPVLRPIRRCLVHCVLKTMFWIKLNLVADATVSFIKRRNPMRPAEVLAADRMAAARADAMRWTKGGRSALSASDVVDRDPGAHT
jgi:hypothetical protein